MRPITLKIAEPWTTSTRTANYPAERGGRTSLGIPSSYAARQVAPNATLACDILTNGVA